MSDIENRVHNLCKKLGMNNTPEGIKWSEITLCLLKKRSNFKLDYFTMEGIERYTTAEHILKGDIPLEAEKDYLRSKCKIQIEINNNMVPTFQGKELKQPNDLIGGGEGKMCKKCKQKDTFSYSKQTRSSDEATDYIFQCNSCNHSWIERSG